MARLYSVNRVNRLKGPFLDIPGNATKDCLHILVVTPFPSSKTMTTSLTVENTWAASKEEGEVTHDHTENVREREKCPLRLRFWQQAGLCDCTSVLQKQSEATGNFSYWTVAMKSLLPFYVNDPSPSRTFVSCEAYILT